MLDCVLFSLPRSQGMNVKRVPSLCRPSESIFYVCKTDESEEEATKMMSLDWQPEGARANMDKNKL